jgi:hypothetical protein
MQPSKVVNGKRVPSGPPLTEYYPRLISDEEFKRTGFGIALRRTGANGRKGEGFSNLFSGLAVCGYCQAPLHFVNKGKGAKGGTSLVCSRTLKGLCASASWRYDNFEMMVIRFLDELDLSALFETEGVASERQALRNKLNSVGGAIISLEEQS